MIGYDLPLRTPDEVPAPSAAHRAPTAEEAFVAFHRDNPHVLDIVIREARRARAAGSNVGGIRMIWERLRWLLTVETKAPDGFKLNNNLHAFYARAAMAAAPDLAGFFVLRSSAADGMDMGVVS